jgi:dynein heavy chain
VLFQEIERYNQLLDTMQKSLVLLKKAIRGIEQMSSELDLMYLAF